MLENLSEEDLVELYKKLEAHEDALAHSKGDIYLENATEDQISFHKAKNRVRVFFGGNRSGKSTGGTNEARWLATGTHPYRRFRAPSKGCIILQDFQTHARDIIVPKIKEWFHPGDIVDIETNQAKVPVKYTLKNGSIIDIKSHDQDLKVFEGSDYDWAWFDEPPPEAIFKAVWRGLTDRRGICFITGTPIVEPWMFDLYKKAQAENNEGTYWAIFSNIHKNVKNIGEGDEEEGRLRIKEFLEALDPDEREAREKGHFLHMSGLIFKEWDRGVHLINEFPWPHSWPIIISLDPHPRKPWAVSFLGLTPSGGVILLRSLKIDDVVEGVAETILFEKGEIVLDREDTRIKVQACWIDNYASVESMIKKQDGRKVTIVDELNFHVQPTIPRFQPAPKNVEDKITLFKDWLKPKETRYGTRPMFFAFDIPENRDFIYEIEHYVWAKQRGIKRNQYKNVPVKENDDILDSIMQVALVLGSKKGQDGRNNRAQVYSYVKRGR